MVFTAIGVRPGRPGNFLTGAAAPGSPSRVPENASRRGRISGHGARSSAGEPGRLQEAPGRLAAQWAIENDSG